jgi:hypothetical protein
MAGTSFLVAGPKRNFDILCEQTTPSILVILTTSHLCFCSTMLWSLEQESILLFSCMHQITTWLQMLHEVGIHASWWWNVYDGGGTNKQNKRNQSLNLPSWYVPNILFSIS